MTGSNPVRNRGKVHFQRNMRVPDNEKHQRQEVYRRQLQVMEIEREQLNYYLKNVVQEDLNHLQQRIESRVRVELIQKPGWGAKPA